MFCFSFFPILLSLYIPTLIALCYLEGTIFKLYYPVLPMVSDTGNYVPPASIFTFLITLIGFLFLVTAALRYIQLRVIINTNHFAVMVRKTGDPNGLEAQRNVCHRLNQLTLYLAIYVAICTSSIGAFRLAETFVWHNLVASGLFFGAPIYMTVQLWFTAKFAPFVNTKGIVMARGGIVAICWFTVVSFLTSMLVSQLMFDKDFFDPMDRLYWNPSNPGFVAHVFSSLMEWIFLMCISPFIFTFAFDFERLTLREYKLEYTFQIKHRSGEGV